MAGNEEYSLYEIILAMPFNWSYKCPCCNEIVTTNQTPKNIKKFYVGRENFNCLNCGMPLVIKNLSEVVAKELKDVYLTITIEDISKKVVLLTIMRKVLTN